MSHPMFLPALLMAMVAPIGGLDVGYFHIWKFRLFKQPTSRAEMVTHLLRAVLFGAGALILFNYEPHGLWFWFVGLLFILDFLNNLADVFTESASRAPLGGLPRMEYIIPTIGGTFAGAITLAFLILGWAYRNDPTALIPLADDALPAWLTLQGKLLVAGSIGLTLLEGTLFVRSMKGSVA